MRIDRIEATVDQKINIGDYENISFPLTLIARLDEGDDTEQCVRELYAQAEKLWAKQVRSRIMVLRKVREHSEDKGIYKLTGRLFDRAIEPVLSMLKAMIV